MYYMFYILIAHHIWQIKDMIWFTSSCNCYLTQGYLCLWPYVNIALVLVVSNEIRTIFVNKKVMGFRDTREGQLMGCPIVPHIIWIGLCKIRITLLPTHCGGDHCNIGYPSEIHLKLKSHKISFIHTIHSSCQIVSKFCTEHGSITAMLCAEFQNDLGNWEKSYGQTSFPEIYV